MTPYYELLGITRCDFTSLRQTEAEHDYSVKATTRWHTSPMWLPRVYRDSECTILDFEGVLVDVMYVGLS